MSGTPCPVPTEWVGWIRVSRRAKWQAVVDGATERECSQRLLDYSQKLESRHNSVMVLPKGEKP